MPASVHGKKYNNYTIMIIINVLSNSAYTGHTIMQ